MDLSTTYMGMPLRSPLVASSSPLSRDIDNIKRMEDAGAGAVVLWSLFEEQLEHDALELTHYLHYGTERYAESLTYYPREPEFRLGPEEYLDHIRRVKSAVNIPIIASLNGVSPRGWTEIARDMQQAGADALELNVYYIPTLFDLTSPEIEQVYLDVLEAVKAHVDVPVAMKISPYFSSMANMAKRLDDAGADALVLFNRFYQPDIDVENLEVVPNLVLSTSADTRLSQRWIAILFDHLKASLAASSGVHTGHDAAKLLLAGADVVMMTSALLKNGVGHLATVRDQLQTIMTAKEYESVKQMRGAMSQKTCPEPGAFERANYMKALTSYQHTATLE